MRDSRLTPGARGPTNRPNMVPNLARFPRPLRPAAAGLLALLLLGLAGEARAQSVRPWTPPGDSLARMAYSAKLRFQRQRGDSVGGDNFDGYQVVADMGRHLLAALGRDHWLQAPAIQATLDSLGLDVEVRIDPTLQHSAFMLVRNPFKRSSDAVGFLYWLRGSELRMQGASYPPAQDVKVRIWYTGRPETPYEAITLYHRRAEGSPLVLRLYRLNEAGVLWNLVQYEGHGPEFGPRSEGDFMDVNHDGQPEVVAFHLVEPDSFLVLGSGVPRLVEEYIYTERPEGFVLHDLRLLPGPVETVNMFATLLIQHEPELARRLLVNPATLDSVQLLGWGQHHGRGAWNIEYGEDQPWPEWLELRIWQDKGWQRWIFHFWIKDDRWVIRDWIPVQPAEKPKTATPILIPPTPEKPPPAAKKSERKP